MMNPYSDLKDTHFWRRTVSCIPSPLVDPVLESTFKIKEDTKVVTAGSCFAQHLAKRLSRSGFQYLITETGEKFSTEHREKNQYGVYSARFGNIYTTRQLRQLLQEVFQNEHRSDLVSARRDGRYVDILRPQVEADGYDSPADVLEDRRAHLEAVSEMFLKSDVFIFTLGLTESWQRKSDGLVVPIAPGVVTTEDQTNYDFINFRYSDVYDDLLESIKIIKKVNPTLEVILTVSPVPLVATYENQHVVVSTNYSKSTLRAVAGDMANDKEFVHYFPSYEIITAPYNAPILFEDDLRNVKKEGVDKVMRSFFKNYTYSDSQSQNQSALTMNIAVSNNKSDANDVFCDEEAIENLASEGNNY